MRSRKHHVAMVMAMLSVISLLAVAGCSSPPSDGTIEKEITEHAAKCTWDIRVPGKEIHQTFSGSRITVVSVEIVAKSFKDTEGSVRFALNGSKTGEGDVENWYGWSKQRAEPFLSDSFRFEGEWLFRKYDKGWKVGEEPKMLVATFQK